MNAGVDDDQPLLRMFQNIGEQRKLPAPRETPALQEGGFQDIDPSNPERVQLETSVALVRLLPVMQFRNDIGNLSLLLATGSATEKRSDQCEIDRPERMHSRVDCGDEYVLP
jgi:hypothetical protein